MIKSTHGDLVGSVLRAARETSGTAAVIGPDGRLSYGDLVARARKTADEMAEIGVARGDRVGIHLPPGGDAVTAAVATLMLRAAYVPLDPQQPAQRTATMLQNCDARLAVT